MIRVPWPSCTWGQPADWRTDVGPLIDSAAADHVRAQLAQAQTWRGKATPAYPIRLCPDQPGWHRNGC